MTDNITIYGVHAVASLLQHRPHDVKKLIIADSREDDVRLQNLLAAANKHKLQVDTVPRRTLDQLLPNVLNQGIAAVCRPVSLKFEPELDILLDNLTVPPFLLILDGIKDPHNLGACLRTADAAGVHAVIVPKDRAVTITPAVYKVACGAVESVPLIQVTNLARVLKQLQDRGVWLFGFSEHADKSLYQANLKGAVAILLGEEEKGLRRLTRDLCDEMLFIPMSGWASSLNVSVATGVSLFEVVRQRKTNP